MGRSLDGRIAALAAVLVAGIALFASATPASAQVAPGTSATPLVGSGIVANCPPAVPAALAGGTASSGDVTVGFPAGARCTPLSADAEGSYTIAGSSPLPFDAACAIVDGTVQHGGGVDVPVGTVVNGVPVAAVTTVTAPNTPVVFPGGRTAILNQVISTPTQLTRNAIAFTGGPIVGQVTCGGPYPLAVDVGGPIGAASELTRQSASSGGSGGPSGALLLAGGVVVIVLAQVGIATTWRRRDSAA